MSLFIDWKLERYYFLGGVAPGKLEKCFRQRIESWLAQWLEGDVFGTIEVVERGVLGQYYHLFLFISSEKWRGLISLNHSALFVLCNFSGTPSSHKLELDCFYALH